MPTVRTCFTIVQNPFLDTFQTKENLSFISLTKAFVRENSKKKKTHTKEAFILCRNVGKSKANI